MHRCRPIFGRRKILWKMGFLSGLTCLASAVTFCAAGGIGYAAPDDFRRAVLFLTGASDLETVGEYELERFEDLADDPLPVNLASRMRLESSGLLSDYQVASLLAYREESGDILSFSELAAVDGFGKEMAEALSVFVSLSSSALPGQSSLRKLPARSRVEAGSSYKATFPGKSGGEPESGWNWWSRCRVTSSGRYDVSVSLRRDYDAGDMLPSSGAFSVAYCGRRALSRLIAGDYSLRFGQGLALWSGFSLSGYSGVRTFWKRGSGLAPSQSLSAGASHSGIAAEFSGRRYGGYAFVSMPYLKKSLLGGGGADITLLPGAGLYRRFRDGRVSVTSFCPVPCDGGALRCGLPLVSADMRFCLRGREVFAEIAYDVSSGTPAAVAGCVFPLNDRWKYAVTGLYMPDGYNREFASPARSFSSGSGEYGVAAGLYFDKMEFTAAYAVNDKTGVRQLKSYLLLPWKMSAYGTLSSKLTTRWRSGDDPSRLDLRLDYRYSGSSGLTAVRANVLKCKGVSYLAYAEKGYVGTAVAAYLRATVFRADNWDDRIYSYERDAPGCFNVPAYYGRGYSAAFVLRVKLPRMKLYLRCAYTDYPWRCPGQEAARPSRFEARMLMVV